MTGDNEGQGEAQGPQLKLFVTAPPGMESLLSQELLSLQAREPVAGRGGVGVLADWATACRICLWSRLANRVLLPLLRFELDSADTLYAQAKTIDWPSHFDVQRSFAIQVAGTSPAIDHTHFAALRLKDAIADRFREHCGERPSVDAERPDVSLHLHLERTHATISLDLSGASLHRRGYRRDGAEAPLKENLAAAILMFAGWPAMAAAGAPLLDPMCGSGTLVIEAAMMAADIAPGLLHRRFGGAGLRRHDPAIWTALLREADERKRAGLQRPLRLLGRDADEAALRAASANARRAGVEDLVDFELADALQADPPDGWAPGLIVVNPPYGVRLGHDSELIKLYSLLGLHLKQQFAGWQLAVFTGRPDLGPRLGLRAHAMHALRNGALDCKLLLIELMATQVEVAEDFANRLRKNLRHLRKWAAREGVTNFRVYDADLPDYAVAVDIYESQATHVLVQEYAAPATVDPAAAERRLRGALAAVQQIFELPAAQLHYKLRKSQKGTAQYERQAQTGEIHIVTEHGCRFAVNFDDYLDTGLFLDHRPMRLRLQREAAGKQVLNLFCYTGTASVHAARGGAKGTTSVDLSANYLDWTARNFALNDLSVDLQLMRKSAQRASPQHAAHRLIQADCLAWLREQAESPRRRYELIFCDPPTFSNSKRMSDTLDIQRDHVEMLRHCLDLLTPDGTLYFSTNRRRFKLDTETLDCDIVDITPQTLGEDFKRPPPAHRCWRLRHRAS